MRILFVWPAAEFSIWDVARGLRGALGRQGHPIRDYMLNRKLLIAQEGIRGHLPEGATEAQVSAVASELASEGVVAHALWHQADAVVIVSGLNLHPGVLWALRRAGIPVAVWLTESPYEDDAQAEWLSANPDTVVFTHERVSAATHGWTYLPHAFDPAVHQPVAPMLSESCDVLLVGTGWRERQQFLEGVNWDGINLRLKGVWPEMTEASPLHKFLEPALVKNEGIAHLYASAAISLNLHRSSETAESLNPRAYEIAGCGGFQLMDARAEARDVFGESVPTFRTPAELEGLIRHYLAHPLERFAHAENARARVQAHTFDARAAALISAMHARLTVAA